MEDYEYYSVDPEEDPMKAAQEKAAEELHQEIEAEIARRTIERIFRPRFNVGQLSARMFGHELMIRCERHEDIESTLLRNPKR